MTMQIYRILVGAQIDSSWTSWFEGMTIHQESKGETRLIGYLPDQAALFSVLMKIRDLGLVLISVEALENETGTSH